MLSVEKKCIHKRKYSLWTYGLIDKIPIPCTNEIKLWALTMTIDHIENLSRKGSKPYLINVGQSWGSRVQSHGTTSNLKSQRIRVTAINSIITLLGQKVQHSSSRFWYRWKRPPSWGKARESRQRTCARVPPARRPLPHCPPCVYRPAFLSMRVRRPPHSTQHADCGAPALFIRLNLFLPRDFYYS